MPMIMQQKLTPRMNIDGIHPDADSGGYTPLYRRIDEGYGATSRLRQIFPVSAGIYSILRY